MLTGLRLFFSGVLKRLLKAGSAVLEWLLSDWRNAPLMVFAFITLVNAVIIKPSLLSDIAEMQSQRDDARDEREATMDAYQQTVANYIAAANQAQAKAEANVERVRVEQAQINQETIDDFEARLAAVRGSAERLRERALRSASGNPGSSGAAGLSGSGNAARGVDEASGDPRLPQGWSCLPGFVCLTIDEALIATEQALQLDALIHWNERQAKVRFSPEVSDD